MSEVVYVSKVRIERKTGPVRIAYLPGESQPVAFSVHGAIAEHYKVDPTKLLESHASTLDYVIAATAGGMMGTFGGALEARQIDASNGRLTADVVGEVEKEEGVLVIRRIHVALRLVAPERARETVERVHGMYAMRCPLFRTLHKAMQLTSSYEMVAPAAASGGYSWRRSERQIRSRSPRRDATGTMQFWAQGEWVAGPEQFWRRLAMRLENGAGGPIRPRINELIRKSGIEQRRVQ